MLVLRSSVVFFFSALDIAATNSSSSGRRRRRPRTDRHLPMAPWSSFRSSAARLAFLAGSHSAPRRARLRGSSIRCYYTSPYPAASVNELADYLLKGANLKDAPKCPDYIGPVFIDRTPDGRGRGLFASRYVHSGDLLLVSNAFAASYNDPHSIQLFTRLVAVVKDSPAALRQLYTLAGSSSQANMVVPSVNMLDRSSCPAEIEAGEDLRYDEMRIIDIMNVNSFEGEATSPLESPKEAGGDS